MPQAQPELKKVGLVSACPPPRSFADNPLQYMEKRVFCQINGNRKVIGVLRGYDVSLRCRFVLLNDSFPSRSFPSRLLPSCIRTVLCSKARAVHAFSLVSSMNRELKPAGHAKFLHYSTGAL